MDKTRDYFNEIAEDYDSSADGKFVKRMYGEVVRQILEIMPEALLDLGCGNGNVLLAVGRQCPARLFGLDISENMISEAEKRLAVLSEEAWVPPAPRPGITGCPRINLRVGDAAGLPYESGAFDAVACNASFHHYLNPEQVLREIRRVLKPGGVLILGDPTAPFFLRPLLNASFSARNSGDHHIYGKREILGLLKSEGFSAKKWKILNFQAFILSAVRV